MNAHRPADPYRVSLHNVVHELINGNVAVIRWAWLEKSGAGHEEWTREVTRRCVAVGLEITAVPLAKLSITVLFNNSNVPSKDFVDLCIAKMVKDQWLETFPPPKEDYLAARQKPFLRLVP